MFNSDFDIRFISGASGLGGHSVGWPVHRDTGAPRRLRGDHPGRGAGQAADPAHWAHLQVDQNPQERGRGGGGQRRHELHQPVRRLVQVTFPSVAINQIKIQIFGSGRSSRKFNLCSFVDESLCRALNLHLGAVWVSLLSVSGLSKPKILRLISYHSLNGKYLNLLFWWKTEF